ncbi:MAG TPA: Arm DNA-binding domain-containing protein, partial [Casimicrobiaceae bacterium]|nr:Arm DNA-binding domain-containing protein [Casimicrobiaceae bacterium]
MPLTDVKVRNAKPDTKPIRLWDSLGLYLEVSPAGGKLWRFKYRRDGKEKLLALGKWKAVSLVEAREARDAARKLLAAGKDPAAEKQTQKRLRKHAAANSFEAVAREWYGKHSPTWTAHHAADVLRRLEANLFPQIGDRAIAEINAPALLA